MALPAPFSCQDLRARTARHQQEFKQVSVGSLGMQVFAHHVTSGGYYISEHPAPPQELERPTVWRAPLTMLMRQHPDAAPYTSNWTVGVAR